MQEVLSLGKDEFDEKQARILSYYYILTSHPPSPQTSYVESFARSIYVFMFHDWGGMHDPTLVSQDK